MSATPVKAVEVRCKRYGPGRLPGADNRSIGAGYAFATAALLATLSFVVLYSVNILLAVGPERLWIEGGLLYFSLLATPFVVPAAFAAGALSWRLVPRDLQYCGLITGLVATVLTYVCATTLVAAAIFGEMLLNPTAVFEPSAAVLAPALFGAFGFVSTGWITLPVGALSGYVHERAVAEN